MQVPLVLTVALVLLPPGLAGQCPEGRLAVYRLELATFWTEETFPKQYPQWRPSAQWSRTVGYSHGPALSLFSLGAPVDEAVRKFVELGDSEELDRAAANRTFLDAVLGPPIGNGAGTTVTNVFVDSNHSRVSVITKMVPSPDWFIGLDSLQLCRGGGFIKSFTTEAGPMDAGTDNGFTFTSPNWETEPRGGVFNITSSFPAHPAGSLHYPVLAALPRLAQYSLTKLREYVLERDPARYQYDVGPKAGGGEGHQVIEFVPMEEQQPAILSNAIPELVPLPKHKQKVSLGGGLSRGFRRSSSSGYHASTAPGSFLKKRYGRPLLGQASNRLYPGQGSAGSEEALYRQILASYSGSRLHPRHAKKRLRQHSQAQRAKRPRGCTVSVWSAWGGCSKSCGIGEAVRRRAVMGPARHGGAPCPKLADHRWCGSARNCKTGYFRW